MKTESQSKHEVFQSSVEFYEKVEEPRAIGPEGIRSGRVAFEETELFVFDPLEV